PVLAERIRSKMGRIVSHPRVLSIDVHEGTVTLHGPVLGREARRLRRALRRMHGIKAIEDQLEVHERQDDVPALQRGGRPLAARVPWMQHNWSPTARLIAGVAGASLVARAIGRRNLPSIAVGVLGGIALVRALVNLETRRIFGVGAGRWALELH